MLSISAITSSAAAIAYYEKDDYYTQGSDEAGAEGAWYGKGAVALGLAGAVDRESFTDVLEGRLPNGSVLGRRIGDEIEHRPGWDLTFSAPKSVSIAAEVGGDERLFSAHDTAAKAALDWLEANAAGTRTNGIFGIRNVRTDNLLIALFQHETSREQDPQLHTHAVVANATQRSDGKWASLESRDLYDFKMAAGNVYRAELAQQVQRIGYHIELTGTDGRFELRGIAPELIAEFSTRRQQIEEAMQKRGLEGAEAAAQAALLTRANKENLPREELLADWTARTADRMPELKGVIEGARAAGDTRGWGNFRLDRAVGKAVDRLAESEAVFTRADLIRWGLAASMGRATVDQVEAIIAGEVASKSLEKTSLGRLEAFTTPAAKEQERRVSDAVGRGRDRLEPMVDSGAVKEAIDASTLAAGQRQALELIAGSSDRFVAIVGRPGTGKSYLMGQTRELLEGHGRTLVGMAANSEAARKLAQDSGIKSGTLSSHLTRAYKDLAAIQDGGAKVATELRERYSRQVWVVDEATQVGSKNMRRLATAAEKLGARVVLIGDPQQLAAIDAGKPFELMLKAGMKYVELDEIRRQQNPAHLTAVRQAIKGQVAQALDTLAADTVLLSDRQARLNAILGAWKVLGDERGDSFILTAGNAEKQALNDGARDVMRSEGKLAGEEAAQQLGRVFSKAADRKEAAFYQVGDLVRFGWNAKSLQVERGEYLRVAGVDRGRHQVTLERVGRDGKAEQIQWNPGFAAGGKRGVEVYRPRDTTLAPGETIRWTRNSTDLKLSNGQLLTVVGVKPGHLQVRTAAGEVKSIDASGRGGQHWEHAYASTVYSSQGGTAKHVLVNAEGGKADLFNQKAFLVAISRQRQTLTLFTDNTEQFKANAEKHLGIKSSAIESREEAARGDVLRGLMDRLEAAKRAEPVRDRQRDERDLSR